MAFTKGNFDAIADIYAPVQVPLRQIQGNPTVLKDYDDDFPIFNGIAANQNLGFDEEFLNIRSKKNLRAYWLMDSDDGTMDDCDDGCEVPDGDEIGAESVDYTPAECKSKGLKTIDTEKLTKESFLNKLTFGFASRQFQIMRYKEREAIAAIAAFADDLTGMNIYGIGSVSTTTWSVPSENAGPEFIYRLMQVAKDQRMIDPVLLVGSAYEYEEMQFKGERGINLTKDANALLQPMMPIYRNRNHFDGTSDAVLGSDQYMLLVDRATIGYFEQNHWMNPRPEERAYETTQHFVHYTELPRVQWRNVVNGVPQTQNLKVDVRFAYKCINEYEYALVHSFKTFGKWVQAPKGPKAYNTVIKIQIT